MPTEPTRHVFEVVSAADSVPSARREAAKVLEAWRLDGEVVFTACLIITELVTNVVRYAVAVSPTATVTLATDGQELTLAVGDADPHCPKPLMPDVHDVRGRGLHLVRSLAAEAGGSHDVIAGSGCRGGKQIVVRLPLHPLPA